MKLVDSKLGVHRRPTISDSRNDHSSFYATNDMHGLAPLATFG
jgi:hypothetical protein